MPFVKLDTGILESTLWIDRAVRDVFITSLLMAEPREIAEPESTYHIDRIEKTEFVVPPGWYGFVPAAGQGIIRRALVEYSEGMLALQKLSDTDPESRSTEFDGRRMVRISGGFLILNYIKYREKDHGAAERMRLYRQRQKTALRRNGYDSLPSVTYADADADADIKPSSVLNEPTDTLFPDSHPSPKKDSRSEKKLLDASFAEIWKSYPRKDGGKEHTREKYEKAVRSTMNGDMRAQCVLVYQRVQSQVDVWEEEGREKKFIPMLCTWLNQQRFDEEPEPLIKGKGTEKAWR